MALGLSIVRTAGPVEKVVQLEQWKGIQTLGWHATLQVYRNSLCPNTERSPGGRTSEAFVRHIGTTESEIQREPCALSILLCCRGPAPASPPMNWISANMEQGFFCKAMDTRSKSFLSYSWLGFRLCWARFCHLSLWWTEIPIWAEVHFNTKRSFVYLSIQRRSDLQSVICPLRWLLGAVWGEVMDILRFPWY